MALLRSLFKSDLQLSLFLDYFTGYEAIQKYMLIGANTRMSRNIRSQRKDCQIRKKLS